MAWIVVTSITSVGIIIFMIINTVTTPHEIDRKHAWYIAYSFALFVIFNTYILYISIVSYKALGRQEDLHPIGKGVGFIWEYFNNETKTAATFFLTSELVRS